MFSHLKNIKNRALLALETAQIAAEKIIITIKVD